MLALLKNVVAEGVASDSHDTSTYYTQQNSVVMPVLNFVIKSRSFGDEELGIGFRTTQAIIGSCSRMFGLMLEGW